MFERFCHIFKANVQEVQNNSVVVELSYVVLLFFLPPLFFFLNFFIFGCVGPSLLHAGFL